MSELPIKLTLKSGAGYDAPWLTVDAADPSDLAFKVAALKEGSLLQDAIELADLFKAAGAIGSNHTPPPAPVQQAAPAASAPGWAQPQAAASAQQGVVFHPEGIKCNACGSSVVAKDVFSKAKNKTFEFWTCPNQRQRDDGHHSSFRN